MTDSTKKSVVFPFGHFWSNGDLVLEVSEKTRIAISGIENPASDPFRKVRYLRLVEDDFGNRFWDKYGSDLVRRSSATFGLLELLVNAFLKAKAAS